MGGYVTARIWVFYYYGSATFFAMYVKKGCKLFIHTFKKLHGLKTDGLLVDPGPELLVFTLWKGVSLISSATQQYLSSVRDVKTAKELLVAYKLQCLLAALLYAPRGD